MATLLRTRPFPELRVRELAKQAGVGRTTFYAHFQGASDLLLHSFCGMLEAMTGRLADDPPEARRLLPIRELFTHVDEARDVLANLGDPEARNTLFELAIAHMTHTLERAGCSAVEARTLGGGAVALLQWWLQARRRPAVEALEAEWHAVARRVLAAEPRRSKRP